MPPSICRRLYHRWLNHVISVHSGHSMLVLRIFSLIPADNCTVSHRTFISSPSLVFCFTFLNNILIFSYVCRVYSESHCIPPNLCDPNTTARGKFLLNPVADRQAANTGFSMSMHCVRVRHTMAATYLNLAIHNDG